MSNLAINEDDKKRLLDLFESKEGEDNYYVYALCDGGVPFYIGKGIGLRCLQHEEDLNSIINEYKEELIEDSDKELLKNELEKELKQKLNHINDSIKRDEFDVAIIKYGLTEHEAFMVESAVINALAFLGVSLDNAINGHSSKRERETGEPTKARLLRDFLAECCPKQVKVEDIKAFVNSNSFPFQSSEDDVVFINFNRYYPYCRNQIDIWESVRCCWKMDSGKAKKAKYIFAMHNNTIKGIFKVKKDGNEVSDYQRIETAEYPLPIVVGSQVKIAEKTKGDNDVITEVVELIKKEPSLRGKHKELCKRIGKEKESFYQRCYFISDINEYAADDDLIRIKNEFLNCHISDPDFKMPQGSIKYLFN